MTSAKVIQLAPVFPASPTTTLDALRSVIGGLDEPMLSSLKYAATRVPQADWRNGVDAGILSERLPKELLLKLSEALAGVRRSTRKAS
jgi:hypothetical protein